MIAMDPIANSAFRIAELRLQVLKPSTLVGTELKPPVGHAKDWMWNGDTVVHTLTRLLGPAGARVQATERHTLLKFACVSSIQCGLCVQHNKSAFQPQSSPASQKSRRRRMLATRRRSRYAAHQHTLAPPRPSLNSTFEFTY